MREIHASAIADAVKKVCMEANCSIVTVVTFTRTA